MLIIVNPAAGRARAARRRLGAVVAALERRGCLVAMRPTDSAPGDAERLAREAETEFDVIVAAGGDGTINGVVNGLVGTDRPFAVLPLGTANVLAREIGSPRRPEALAELIATGVAQPVWPGRIDDRLFLMMAGSGFDADAVAAVDPRWKRRIGRLAFAWAILRCLRRYRACELVVAVDGIEHRAASAIGLRGRYYAGPFLIAPQAALHEQMLDLVLFRRTGRLAVLRYLGALLRGALPRRPDVTLLRCRQATLSAGQPVLVQADGEIVGRLPVTLGIAEQPLFLIRP